jgi:hypothetical protein
MIFFSNTDLVIIAGQPSKEALEQGRQQQQRVRGKSRNKRSSETPNKRSSKTPHPQCQMNKQRILKY